MNRSSPKGGSITALVTVLLLLTVGLLGATGTASAASTIYVDSGAPDPTCAGNDYATIQNAVDNATAGDTIVVCGGTYSESVTINKELTLVANDGSDVELVGKFLPSGSTAITVESNAAGTIIEGFTATGFESVVNVSNAGDTVVRDLLARNSNTGVAVSASGTTMVSNVTIQNVTLDSISTGLHISSSDDGQLSDVVLFRNVINGSDTAVLIDGDSSVPLADVSVRQNLLANATSAAVTVTSTTNVNEVSVTRNFFQDNAPLGIENQNTSSTLKAWLNYWGADSGPGSLGPTVSDPISGTQANGTGDNVSSNVHFDPWIGKGACADPQLVNATDRTFEVFNQVVKLSQLQPTCIWERAALPLRANDADAATSVRNPQVFIRTDSTGDVPINRPRFSVYQQGEDFEVRFEPTVGTDLSRFAGNDTQLLVLRNGDMNTDFEVAFDNRTGEGRLKTNADSVSVIDTGALNGDGELTHTFTPASEGDYTFVLVMNDFGSGVRVESSDEIRLDGGITVIGIESIPVQNKRASASTAKTSYSTGQNVTFNLGSNLNSDTTNHAVFLYNKNQLTSSRTTIELEGDLSNVLAGELSGSDITVERSISNVSGTVRVETGVSVFGFDLAKQDRSGQVDLSPFLDVATSRFGINGVTKTTTADATLLNGSVLVVQTSGSDTTVDVETFQNFSTGTYRYLYVAEQGSKISSDTGTVTLTAETDGGDGGDGGGGGGGDGGGGGGFPGGGADGEVNLQDATLLNGTVATGEPVAVRVNLTNPDPIRGRITLKLTADGEVVSRRTVTVAASSSRTVFVRNRFGQAGSYDIALNGIDLGTITVSQMSTETPHSTSTPTGGATPTLTDTPEPTPTDVGPTPPPESGGPTGLEIAFGLGLVLALLAAVGVMVYILPRPSS